MSNSVVIIVLNWNGAQLTIDCLKSLESITYKKSHILVVDNGSTDDSIGRITTEFPQVTLLRLVDNLGYAVGNNRGFDYAKEKWNSDFCIFLNNDTIVDKGFVEYLIEPFIDDSIHVTVPKIYYYDKPESIWYAGGRLNLWLGKAWHVGIRENDSIKFNQVEDTDYATGCCLCICSDIYENHQGFSEDFSMYAEDADLSLRIREAGGRIQFVPQSKVWHKVSASVGGELSFIKIKRKYRGQLNLFLLHANKLQWLTIILCSLFLFLSNIIKYLSLRFFSSKDSLHHKS